METEVIIKDENDAYEKLRNGLVLTHAVNDKKGQLDDTEMAKGAGFPLVRALALYCKGEAEETTRCISKFKSMLQTTENALLESMYDKSPENYTTGRGWNVRKLLGSTWASAKSVVLSAIENDIELSRDSRGKLLGKSAIEELIHRKKARAKKALSTGDKRTERIQSLLEEIEKLQACATSEKESDRWTDAYDIVELIKSGSE